MNPTIENKTDAGEPPSGLKESAACAVETVPTAPSKPLSGDNPSAFARAMEVTKRVISNSGRGATDPATLDALVVIQGADETEYLRQVQAISSACGAAYAPLSVRMLERMVKTHLLGGRVKATHSGYAMSALRALGLGDVMPVSWRGCLYVPYPDGMWVELKWKDLISKVVELHDGHDGCCREADYKAIANLAIASARDDAFFDEAPDGLACFGKFYRVSGDTVVCADLKLSDRQRFGLDYLPTPTDTAHFSAFLDQTYKAEDEEESRQQIALVQEIIGATMLGLLHRYQKAVLFYDPHGRAGKGTMDRIIRRLVPGALVTAVSPFAFDKEVNIAQLAGARLNTVGELPNTGEIPAAAFKSMLGADLLTGRNLYKDPFTFQSKATHLFMSNSLIRTTDHSDAFFARWIIVEFPNSLIKLGRAPDEGLADRIIAAELPGIASWALEGAKRLLKNGKFTASKVQDRLLATWRRKANSLFEFIHEECELGPEKDHYVKRSELYKAYEGWCLEERNRPFKKANVLDLLSHNAALGIRHSTLGGHEVFRGVKIKGTTPGKPMTNPDF